MRTSFVWLFWKGQENPYRLDQDIVLPKQKCGPGVLVKWFNIFPHPHKRAIIHATTGLSLLDLLGIKRRKNKTIAYSLLLVVFTRKHSIYWLSNQGRSSGGGILPTVTAVNTMPLYKLICRWISPEMVCSLNLGVLQSTGANCKRRLMGLK